MGDMGLIIGLGFIKKMLNNELINENEYEKLIDNYKKEYNKLNAKSLVS